MLKDLCISQGPATWEIVELSLHRQIARTGHSEVDDEGKHRLRQTRTSNRMPSATRIRIWGKG